MEERKFIRMKKEEYGIKESVKRKMGKGKISRLDIEYTPVGEKIIISTSRPGLIIGRRGEKIEELTRFLKQRFKLENPHIDINEIKNPLFDAQLVADEIALALESRGNLKFKVIAYRKLSEIMKSGALGCELRLTGKLPSDRAKSWRFAEGYLKKAGESKKEVDRALSTALTKTGVIGIKVAIMPPDARLYDRVDINDELKKLINETPIEIEEEVKKKKKKKGKTAIKITNKGSTGKKDKADLLLKGEVKIIEDKEIKPEEDGTAMKIEEELEEGVPQDIIDKELREEIEEKEKPNKEEKTSEDKK
jgi:small subunit ribosomal protein S3